MKQINKHITDCTLICSHPNRLHYRSCLPVCLWVWLLKTTNQNWNANFQFKNSMVRNKVVQL